MAKKFVISDLDGTLLDNVENLSNKYAKRLNKLIDLGLDFTICTGRDFENTYNAINNVHFENPIILTNGAIMMNYPNGKIIEYLSIPKETSLQILEKSSELNISPMVFASFDEKKNTSRFIKGQWRDPLKIKPLDNNYMQFIDEPIISIQYCDKKEHLDQFYNEIFNKFQSSHILYFEDAFLPDYYWLEFNPLNANKENMVKKLIKIKGYKPEDLLIFGDQKNDLGMLEMAGTACVVENGINEVKKIADVIIQSNKNGGVIQFLEENIDEII